jgi:hypothetical protein
MIIDSIRQTIMITSLVLVMMLLIEYINILSKGNWGKNLYKSKVKQVIVSSLLGLVPGCIGGFAVVSMFTHDLVNFGALVANMIASSGDESFVMLSMFPKTALLLNVIIFVIAIVAGLLVNMFIPRFSAPFPGKTHMRIHTHELNEQNRSWKSLAENLKRMSFPRAVLIFGLLLFMFGLFTGQFGHSSQAPVNGTESHSEWGFENILFIGLSVVTLYILMIVDEHFLEEHLWKHIIKKHFVRILLWTFGALLGIEFLAHYVDITPWLQKNHLTVLLIAVLVGIIPESGPHLVFVTLFFNKSIPFSILLASSIVQDGHGALPLLAESKRSFFLMKGINFIIGYLFGLAGYFMGW